MIGEVTAATSALAGIKTIVDGFVAERDAMKLQQTRAELFKLVADAWQAVFALQMAMQSKVAEVAKLETEKRELEEELTRAKAGATQFEGYELAQVAKGLFVYTSAPEADGSRKPPYLCPACMSDGARSILNFQRDARGEQSYLVCLKATGHKLAVPRGLWSIDHLGRPPSPPSAGSTPP